MQTLNIKRNNLRSVAKKESKQFPIIIEEDPIAGGFVVSCPILQGCYTQGDTIDEALQNIKEVINICLEELDAESKNKLLLPRDMTFCMMKI